jgi:hypothetical protein
MLSLLSKLILFLLNAESNFVANLLNAKSISAQKYTFSFNAQEKSEKKTGRNPEILHSTL